MEEKIYVRLYPFAPRRGYVARGVVMDGQVYKGGERPNWYCVSSAVAETLRPLKQIHNLGDSKDLFQIVYETEKLQIESDEQKRFLASIGAIGETLIGSHEVAPPPTHDLRDESESEIKKLDTIRKPGRAAAIPKPRDHVKKETATGVIMSKDVAPRAMIGEDKNSREDV